MNKFIPGCVQCSVLRCGYIVYFYLFTVNETWTNPHDTSVTKGHRQTDKTGRRCLQHFSASAAKSTSWKQGDLCRRRSWNTTRDIGLPELRPAPFQNMPTRPATWLSYQLKISFLKLGTTVELDIVAQIILYVFF